MSDREEKYTLEQLRNVSKYLIKGHHEHATYLHECGKPDTSEKKRQENIAQFSDVERQVTAKGIIGHGQVRSLGRWKTV